MLLRLVCFFVSVMLSISAVASSAVITPVPASGHQAQSHHAIDLADILARANLMEENLNLIRQAMGKPPSSKVALSVKNASLRDNLFDGRVLYEKANQLAYEVTESYEALPKTNEKEVTPEVVWNLLNDSLKRILLVKKFLGIKKSVVEKVPSSPVTPTEVMNKLLQVNHNINGILIKKTSPSDVFQQITLSVNYMADMLKPYPGVNRLPAQPVFEANKRPIDVMVRLTHCFAELKEIAQDLHRNMLVVVIDKNRVYQVTPSNVYDIATILLSETKFISRIEQDKSAQIVPYYPGFKTPSLVYQRAGILLAQLQSLKAQLAKRVQ